MALNSLSPLRLIIKEIQCLDVPLCLVLAGGCHALAVRHPGRSFIPTTDKSFIQNNLETFITVVPKVPNGFHLNTLRTGDADLRFYITTLQDG